MKPKTILITGANGSIGFACVQKFLEQGYLVVAHYHTCDDRLKTLKTDKVVLIQGDLSCPQEVKRVFAQALEKCERLDALFNSAGMLKTAPSLEMMPLEDFDQVMNVNLRAAFQLSQLTLMHMKEHSGGRIINISSIGIKYGGNPISASYTISKAAVESMTLSFAKAGAPHNVLVNVVRAGLTNTGFLKHNPSKNLEKRIELIPVKRIAEPQEVASVVYFLASPESSYISGSILTVAGGE